MDEVEKSRGCPKNLKKKLLAEYRELYNETQEIFNEIQNLLREKKLPPEWEGEYQNFLRTYNIIREMEHEMELHPAPNCGEYFDKLL